MMDDDSRAAIVAEVKRELQTEMGLLPVTLLRDRRNSFVELNSYDDRGTSNYGTAGYLGNGYFITVKHAVVALGRGRAAEPAQDHVDQARSTSGKAARRPRSSTPATPTSRSIRGDWAIVKVQGAVDLPALHVDTALRLRLRRPDLPARQRLLEGHHPLDRLRRPAHVERPGDLPDRRPPRRVGRRRARPATATWSASRSAGCRATIASRSSCRCVRRC